MSEIIYDINFKPFFNNLRGKIKPSGELTYSKLLDYLIIKHELNPYQLSILRIPNLNDVVQGSLINISFNTNPIGNTKTSFDFENYELGILKFKYFKPQYNNVPALSLARNQPLQIETTEIVKIIQKDSEENKMILKLKEPRQVNWYRGPTVGSKYIYLDKQKKKIYPVYTCVDHNNFEKFILEFGICANKNENAEYDYWSIEKKICENCMDPFRFEDQHTNCGCIVSCCSECISKLDKCPKCKVNIIDSTSLTFL